MIVPALVDEVVHQFNADGRLLKQDCATTLQDALDVEVSTLIWHEKAAVEIIRP